MGVNVPADFDQPRLDPSGRVADRSGGIVRETVGHGGTLSNGLAHIMLGEAPRSKA